MMQFREKRRKPPLVNITPLIDVLFLLLIFFMVTSTFIEQPNIKLELPRTAHADVSRIEKLTVTISKDGTLYFGPRRVSKRELSDLLLDAALRNPRTPLVIRADKDAAHGVVIEVLDMAKGAGLTKVVLPTEPASIQPPGGRREK